MPIMKGNVKLSKLQKDIDSTLLFQTPLSKPSPIQVAPPLREDSDFKAVCFIDTSSYRQNNEWNYKAVALEEATRERLSETEKGSAQVRELRAVLLVAQYAATFVLLFLAIASNCWLARLGLCSPASRWLPSGLPTLWLPLKIAYKPV